jgi:MFS family permease
VSVYWVGHLNLLYVIDVTLADMTTLKNRMLMLTINGTPTIAATFAGPAIAELFYLHSTFRWGFGALLVILVGVTFPVALVMLYNERKANKLGVLPEKVSERTVYQSIKYYFIQFDGSYLVKLFMGEELTQI